MIFWQHGMWFGYFVQYFINLMNINQPYNVKTLTDITFRNNCLPIYHFLYNIKYKMRYLFGVLTMVVYQHGMQ